MIRILLAALLPLLYSAPRPDDSQIEHRIADLRSQDDGAWRVAQVELARQGVEALPLLDAVLGNANDQQRDRVRGIVELMLLKSISADDLEAHAKLRALCKRDLDRATTLIEVLAKAHTYDSGDHGLLPPDEPPTYSAERRAFMEAVKTGGASPCLAP